MKKGWRLERAQKNCPSREKDQNLQEVEEEKKERGKHRKHELQCKDPEACREGRRKDRAWLELD